MTTTGNPTMADVKRRAKQIGATVEHDTAGLQHGIYIDLPAGKIIQGSHGTIETYIGREQKVDAMRACLNWMAWPVEDGCECSDQSNCDVCNP